MLPHRETYLLDADGQRVSVSTGRYALDGTPETEPLLAADYSATNGAFTLTIRAGTRRGPSHLHPRVSLGVPSGGLARLLLCHVVTQALKQGSPTVDLGRTIGDLCTALEVTPSGGNRGRLRYLFDQLLRLATCSASFQWESGTGYGDRGREHYRGESLLLVEAYDL
ncbi:replication protein RepA [Rubrivirga sp.]|uniref:replication protein RepA n=1 Tax=Rubrivirga sp. TaxID=1885344 RepID=UPI003C7659A5